MHCYCYHVLCAKKLLPCGKMMWDINPEGIYPDCPLDDEQEIEQQEPPMSDDLNSQEEY